MKTINVTVTKEHIQKGVRCMSNACPIALALRDACGISRISIYRTIKIDGAKVAEAPKNVYRRIKRYDNGTNMKPFTFTFEIEEKHYHLLWPE